MLLGARGQGVGADSDDSDERGIPHDKTMDRIRRMSLDNLMENEELSDAESTDSDISTDSNLLHDDMQNLQKRPSNMTIPSITIVEDNNQGGVKQRPESRELSSSNEKSDTSIEEETEKVIKETVEKIDSSYDVITSHSIAPLSPDAIDILPEFDITDSGRRLLNNLNEKKRARSMTDLSSTSMYNNRRVVDITEQKTESAEDLSKMSPDMSERTRCMSMPQKGRKWSSFSIGVKPNGYDSPVDTPESRKRQIEMFAKLSIQASLTVNGSNESLSCDDTVQ